MFHILKTDPYQQKKIQLLISPDSRKLALTTQRSGLLQITTCKESNWNLSGPQQLQDLLIPSSWGTNPRDRDKERGREMLTQTGIQQKAAWKTEVTLEADCFNSVEK